jgi:hypothetical protein
LERLVVVLGVMNASTVVEGAVVMMILAEECISIREAAGTFREIVTADMTPMSLVTESPLEDTRVEETQGMILMTHATVLHHGRLRRRATVIMTMMIDMVDVVGRTPTTVVGQVGGMSVVVEVGVVDDRPLGGGNVMTHVVRCKILLK